MTRDDGGNKITLIADAHHNGFILTRTRIKLPTHFMGMHVESCPPMQLGHEETKLDVPIENILVVPVRLVENPAEGNMTFCYRSRLYHINEEVAVTKVVLGVFVGLWRGTGRAREV
jgi:hypothetical protein